MRPLVESGKPPTSGPVQLLVHDWLLVHRNDAFWRWWTVSLGTAGSDGVVVSPPLPNDDLDLLERVGDLAIEEFIPEAGIEAFAVAVFPGQPRKAHAERVHGKLQRPNAG